MNTISKRNPGSVAALRQRYGRNVDGEWSETTERIKSALRCDRIDLNRLWALASQDWHCPACRRSKEHIARLLEQGVILMNLVEHHDHFDEYPKRALKALRVSGVAPPAGSREHGQLNYDFESITEKLTDFAPWFDKTVICGDCNVAEASAKARIKAPADFSFPIEMIGEFIKSAANRDHIVDGAIARNRFEELMPSYESRKQLVDAVLAKTVAGKRFHIARMGDVVDRFTTADLEREFDRKSKIKDGVEIAPRILPDSWLSRDGRGTSLTRIAPARTGKAKVPTPADIMALEASTPNAKWRDLSPEWRCGCCGLTRNQAVFWNGKRGRWTHNICFLQRIGICENCQIARVEAKNAVGAPTVDFIDTVEKLRGILVGIQPHKRHEIDVAAVVALFEVPLEPERPLAIEDKRQSPPPSLRAILAAEHRLEITCDCGRRKLLDVPELVNTVDQDTTIDVVLGRMTCRSCGARGQTRAWVKSQIDSGESGDCK